MKAKELYDVVVIGGGVGGLNVASASARLGASVALVEKEALGGDCLYHGCVPSKTLIRTATSTYETRQAGRFGVLTDNIRVDFTRVMDRLHSVIERIGERDSPDRFRKMGVDVFFGSGRFQDPRTFVLDGTPLRGKKFVIATGSGPRRPPIPGLDEVHYQTNLTIFDLDHLPRSMVVLGGGPIGVEMAQAFQRMGCQTTILEKSDYCLRGEDSEVSELLEEQLAADGVRILTGHRGVKVDLDKNGFKRVHTTGPNGEQSIAKGEELLVGAGRKPNTEGLGLEAAGVRTDDDGFIVVDRRMRTSRKHIYALGDCTGGHMFTHVAEYEASIVVPNALYGIPRKADYSAAPHCTYSEPEVAHVGLTETRAKQAGHEVQVYRYPLNESDRQIIDNRDYGLVKLVCSGRKLLGATIIAHDASDLLHECVTLIVYKRPITTISNTFHLYPSLGQAVRRAADNYYRERFFKGRLVRFLKKIKRLRGTVGGAG
jgi:pyruvate/2-oxoglutarate dehydrogenase complex dihydrolipoamide dehydrogenase (E3) component